MLLSLVLDFLQQRPNLVYIVTGSCYVAHIVVISQYKALVITGVHKSINCVGAFSNVIVLNNFGCIIFHGRFIHCDLLQKGRCHQGPHRMAEYYSRHLKSQTTEIVFCEPIPGPK